MFRLSASYASYLIKIREAAEESRSGAAASSGSVSVIGNLRWAAAGVVLFLVVAIDFTSKIMPILADGVLVAGVIALLLPLIKSSK